VKREAEPGDRRVVRLCLTATGRSALERADAAYAAWLGSLLGTTGDPDGMLQAMRTLDAAMDERRRARMAERSQAGQLNQAAQVSQAGQLNQAAQVSQPAQVSLARSPSQAGQLADGEHWPPAIPARETVLGAVTPAGRTASAGPA
jgi:hypothetical protein